MLARHVFPDSARVGENGHLMLGGCDAVDLASEFGTPLYVYDEDTLRNRCRAFTEGFQSRYAETTVVYAGKAYINPALAQIFSEEGVGLDVVSGGELAVAQSVDFPSSGVYFHGNNKSRAELEQALSWNIGRVVIDNFYELDLLEEIAADMKRTQAVLLRISPGIDPHTHVKTTTGILDSKFGFPVETGDAVRAVKLAIKAPHIKVMGIHFHLGSPIFDLDPYRAAMELALAFASDLRKDGLNLEEVSPGGGFAIAYTQEQHPPTVADYAEAIVSSLTNGCKNNGLEFPRLIIEPGRAITGPSGVALYSVGSIKDIPGVRNYVAVDGGMGDNIRPALYEASYEAVVANRMNAKPTKPVTIAGKYCESGDVLVRDVALPPMVEGSGDIIAIPAAGAYCLSMASNYNLNPKPAVVLVRSGVARLIRRRETYQDQMNLDVT